VCRVCGVSSKSEVALFECRKGPSEVRIMDASSFTDRANKRVDQAATIAQSRTLDGDEMMVLGLDVNANSVFVYMSRRDMHEFGVRLQQAAAAPEGAEVDKKKS
jgi:hypothetical protein